MPYIDALDIPQIPSTSACMATDLSVFLLQGWTRVLPALMPHDANGATPDAPSSDLLTLRQVLHLAIMAALDGQGAGLRMANNIARGFTRLGQDTKPGESMAGDGQHAAKGITLLVADLDEAPSEWGLRTQDVSKPEEYRAVFVEEDFDDHQATLDATPEVVVAVNVTRIERRVRRKLGFPAEVARRGDGTDNAVSFVPAGNVVPRRG
jgi:hypothetical protein